MKKSIVATVFAIGLATPLLAASQYFVTVDTVGNCSVIEGAPSAGQTAVAETAGYASKADAEKALADIRKDDSKCKGVVE